MSEVGDGGGVESSALIQAQSLGGDFLIGHGVANHGGDAVEDGVIIGGDGVVESQVGGADGAGGLAEGLRIAAGSEQQHGVEVRVEAPLGAAGIVGLVLQRVVGADADLEMQVSIRGGTGLAHDSDLSAARDGVPFGVSGN